MVIFLFELHSFFLQQKTHVDRVKKVCENKDFCKVIMPSEDIIIEKMFNRKD